MNTKKDQNTNQCRLYTDLSWIWPIISPPEAYGSESQEFVDLIHQHSSREVKTLLHLGCGGGHHDHNLRDHFDITGIDINPAMVSLAAKLNPGVAYFEGDMRSLRTENRFDAVLMADSVNYMLSEDELSSAFTTAYECLAPGGVLVVCAEYTVEQFEGDTTRASNHARDNIEITYMENRYDPDPSDTTFELTFVYLIRVAGHLQIETDRHLCGVFPRNTWERLLQESGFVIQDLCFDPTGSWPIFTCTKPES